MRTLWLAILLTFAPSCPLQAQVPQAVIDNNVYALTGEQLKQGGWLYFSGQHILLSGQFYQVPRGASYTRAVGNTIQFAASFGPALPAVPAPGPRFIPEAPRPQHQERPAIKERSVKLYLDQKTCNAIQCRLEVLDFCMGTPVMKVPLPTHAGAAYARYGILTAAHCLFGTDKLPISIRNYPMTDRRFDEEHQYASGYEGLDSQGRLVRKSYRDIGIIFFTASQHAIPNADIVPIGSALTANDNGATLHAHRQEGITRLKLSEFDEHDDTVTANTVSGRHIIQGDSGGALIDDAGYVRSVISATQFEQRVTRLIVDQFTGQQFAEVETSPTGKCNFTQAGINVMRRAVERERAKVERLAPRG